MLFESNQPNYKKVHFQGAISWTGALGTFTALKREKITSRENAELKRKDFGEMTWYDNTCLPRNLT